MSTKSVIFSNPDDVIDFVKIVEKYPFDMDVYDLSNCPIPDYPNCLETAQSCVHNSSF